MPSDPTFRTTCLALTLRLQLTDGSSERNSADEATMSPFTSRSVYRPLAGTPSNATSTIPDSVAFPPTETRDAALPDTTAFKMDPASHESDPTESVPGVVPLPPMMAPPAETATSLAIDPVPPKVPIGATVATPEPEKDPLTSNVPLLTMLAPVWLLAPWNAWTPAPSFTSESGCAPASRSAPANTASPPTSSLNVAAFVEST